MERETFLEQIIQVRNSNRLRKGDRILPEQLTIQVRNRFGKGSRGLTETLICIREAAKKKSLH